MSRAPHVLSRFQVAPCHFSVGIVSGLYESQQMLHGLILWYIFLHTFLAAIERDAVRTGSYVAVVGVGHFAGTVDYASHDADLESYEVAGGGFYAADGVLQVI